MDSKKIQDFAKKNLALVVSYSVVILCLVLGWYLNTTIQVDLAKAGKALNKKLADLKRLAGDDTATADLPTDALVEHYEATKDSYSQQEASVVAIYEKADEPLEQWFSAEAKTSTPKFAAEYETKLAGLLEKYAALISTDSPPAALRSDGKIDKFSDTLRIQKEFNIADAVLAACQDSGVEQVRQFEFEAARTAPPSKSEDEMGDGQEAETKVSVDEIRLVLEVSTRLPRVSGVVQALLKADIPFRVRGLTVTKMAFTVDQLHKGLRPDSKVYGELVPLPNENQPKASWTDLIFQLETKKTPWTAADTERLLPEPPVLLRIALAALDIEIMKPTAEQ
jgi:hypothetical protein